MHGSSGDKIYIESRPIPVERRVQGIGFRPSVIGEETGLHTACLGGGFFENAKFLAGVTRAGLGAFRRIRAASNNRGIFVKPDCVFGANV